MASPGGRDDQATTGFSRARDAGSLDDLFLPDSEAPLAKFRRAFGFSRRADTHRQADAMSK